MALVAIQIENNQILVAAARASSKRLQVSHLFAVELEGGDEVAAEALKSKLGQHGLSRSDAIVVISRADTEMRELEIPPAPDNEIPEMVRFVARNEFASLNENWVLDYLPISGDATQSRKVLAAGISHELREQIERITNKSGLKVKHMVLRPCSTLDLIHSKLSDDRCRLIVSPNGDQTDMIMAKGALLVATRTVRVPESYDANRREDTLLSEIRRTLASSKSLLGDQQVSEVVIFGDADQHKPLAGNLRSQLEIGIDFVDASSLVPFASGCQNPEHAERYAGVLGALAQDFSNRGHAIDFVNPRRPIIIKRDFSKWYLYGGLAAAAAMLGLMVGWYALNEQTKKIGRHEETLSNLRRLTTGDESAPGVDTVLAEIEKIDAWLVADVNWLKEMNEYSARSLTPDDAIVDSLEAIAPLRDGSDPRMVVNMRITEVAKESDLIEELGTRPYKVKPTRGTIDANDKSYPLSSSLNISMERDAAKLTIENDERASEYIERLNSVDETSGGSESPDPETESAQTTAS